MAARSKGTPLPPGGIPDALVRYSKFGTCSYCGKSEWVDHNNECVACRSRRLAQTSPRVYRYYLRFATGTAGKMWFVVDSHGHKDVAKSKLRVQAAQRVNLMNEQHREGATDG